MEIYNQTSSASIVESSNEVKEIDKELEELLKKQTTKIKVIGIGGGGNNSLS